MSFMFELYYHAPEDLEREAPITRVVVAAGGRLQHREQPSDLCKAVILTYEFDSRTVAETVAEVLRQQGEHIEGPMDYGPD